MTIPHAYLTPLPKTQTTNNQRFTTTYTYDEYDRMTSQTYPSGKVIGYEYDDKGELVSMSIDGVPFIKNIKTNDNGLLSYEYNDGSKHTRTYDTNGRVTKLSYPNYTEEVDYNVVSNITKIKADTISRTFGYDNLDRLTSYEQNATEFQKFVYDANGNRLNQNQENNLTKLFSYRPNSNILNSIKESNTTDTTNISYEYDATGNIIKDDKHTYTYDSRNRLVAVDSNVTYQYNYDNKRVSKTVNGVKTYFIYDGHKLIGEYKLNLSDDSRQEYVYLNSTPIAVMRARDMGRVYADHLDTPRRVATDDEDAQIVWKWEGKPFGETEASGEITFNLRFPGQYFDTELKTHYNINRDYNPVTGRYIQSDPIGFDGGVNSYVYVGNNPISRIDEEGTCVSADAPAYEKIVFGVCKKILTFKGTFETIASVGAGETAMIGTYNDEQTGKNGRFKSVGFAWGFDFSIGAIIGEVNVKNAYSKFMGKGTSIGIGYEMIGGGFMFSNGELIGMYFTADKSPLPVSFTFSATTTTEF